jgi:hypothetical protein
VIQLDPLTVVVTQELQNIPLVSFQGVGGIASLRG